MVNTKISDLGSRKIALSGKEEIRVPAKGDGTSKSGDAVGIAVTTGYAVRSDIGASELFIGILDDQPDMADDTAITAGKACSVIIPQSGHKYRVKMEDSGASQYKGQPLGFSDTAGAFEDVAALSTAGCVATLAKDIVDDDTVCEIYWR